jgi:hypothetical protein
MERGTLSKRRRYARWLLGLLAGSLAIVGCGGGGGGGLFALLQGRVLVVSNVAGDPPIVVQGARVSAGGVSTTSDAQGKFNLRVPANALSITIAAQGLPTLTQNLPTLTPEPAINQLGDITLAQAGSNYSATASGRVLRADTRDPVINAKVLLNGQVFFTTANGDFNFRNLPVGLGQGGTPVGLVSAPGFEDKPIILDFPLESSPPDNNLGNILLSPPVGGTPGLPTNIRGTITLQGQNDHSGTTVTLIDRNTGQPVGTPQVTGIDGKYGFYVVAGQYTVRAEHAGFQTQTRDVDLARPDQPVTVNMTLAP